MIDNKAKYHFVYISVSFSYNIAFCKQLKAIFPIEIPFLEFGNTSDEMKRFLDSYFYIKDSPEFKNVLKKIVSKYPQVIFTHLGEVKGLEIYKFINTCESEVLESIQKGNYYRLTQGSLQNLVLKAVGIENNEFIGTYSVLNEIREVRVPVGEVEYVENYPYKDNKKYFTDYIKKAQKMGHKKAIIIDGDTVLYRNIFGYNKLYTTRTRKFVGGAFGFYFTLLKLKELFVEYEVHVVFDGYPKEKFEQNPHYKANRVKKTDRFKAAYKSNRDWVMRFVKAVGFNLYLLPDKEADDVIGSLATLFTEQLGYQHTLIYATDNDFYQLVNNKIQIYQPKVSFRGHSQLITVEDVLEKYPVGDTQKINWYRALKGDASDNIPSINTSYSKEGVDAPFIKSKDYLPLIESAKDLEKFTRLMFTNEKLNRFVVSGQFHDNLNLLTIDTQVSLAPIEKFRNEFDDAECQKLLEENCFFKELEIWQRNHRVLTAMW